MRTHPITGMTLEDGFGRLKDDQQALILHCAYIEQTQGEAAADAMRAKIRAAMNPPVENLRAASIPPAPAKPVLVPASPAPSVTDGKPVQ